MESLTEIGGPVGSDLVILGTKMTNLAPIWDLAMSLLGIFRIFRDFLWNLWGSRGDFSDLGVSQMDPKIHQKVKKCDQEWAFGAACKKGSKMRGF